MSKGTMKKIPGVNKFTERKMVYNVKENSNQTLNIWDSGNATSKNYVPK